MLPSSLVATAYKRLRRSWNKYLFDRTAITVFSTDPLCLRGKSPLFLSMICHRDVVGYLLAIKSLYNGVRQGRVAVINDGSLTLQDLDILSLHIPGIGVFNVDAIETGCCCRGNTWERLVKIIELSADDYVIQVDADILVSGAIPEVVECWQANRSFLLGTGSGRRISPVSEAARMVQGWIEAYGWVEPTVCVAAEAALDRLPDAARRSYVHASSGFAGFARGGFSMADLERFSTEMSGILGERHWNEWGSEQIASNYMLANSPDATVLPFPKYACFEPHLPKGDHALLHFIGSYRYNDGVYRQRAAQFISCYGRALVPPADLEPADGAARSPSL